MVRAVPPAFAPFPKPPAFASEIQTIGVTGTNGKTTTTAMIAKALEAQFGPTLRITTVGTFWGEERLSLPETYDGFLAAMRLAHERSGRRAAIELTSEALFLGFAKAWPVSIAVFTNLSRDHLDAHGSVEHYLASKAQLFLHLPPGGVAVLHDKDPASALLAEIVPPHARTVWYGIGGSSKTNRFVGATHLRFSWEGTRIALEPKADCDDFPSELRIRLVGAMYAENALGAFAAALVAGVPAHKAARALEEMEPPPGRFQVLGEGPRAIVDYAHSPDALRRTLETARALTKGKLSVVFGAGGERDRGKRPQMGEAAASADRIVLTSDNPRGESAQAIAEAIRAGIGAHPSVRIELDRARAIEETIACCGPDDVVLIAGRGPETTQLFASGNIRLVDAEVALAALSQSSGSSVKS